MEQAAEQITESDAAGYPRAIQFPPERPIFLMEEWEMPFRKPLPVVHVLPFIAYIDDRLQVHFEINQIIRIADKRRLSDFVFPKEAYAQMAPALIKASLLKDKRRLIGGMDAFFHGSTKTTEVGNLGILPRKETADMPQELRLAAFGCLFDRFHAFNEWLGAREIHSGPTVIPPAKAARFGWEKSPPKGFWQMWRFYKQSFPFCLRRKHHAYVKLLKPPQPETCAAPISKVSKVS